MRSLTIESVSSAAIAPVSTVPSALRVGWPTGSPAATSASRQAAAPVAAAVDTKIGPRKSRERAHTGTAVEASSTPV